MTQEEYLANKGLRCPECRSGLLDVVPPTYEIDYVKQQVMCEDCGLIWEDTYKLTGFTKLN